MTDDEIAALLVEALDGRKLTPKESRDLAKKLRRIVELRPPEHGGPDAALCADLLATADKLDPPRGRRGPPDPQHREKGNKQ